MEKLIKAKNNIREYFFIFVRKAIPCDSIIRLQHAGTNKFLHSHQHRSPLSNQQEISAFDGLDSGT